MATIGPMVVFNPKTKKILPEKKLITMKLKQIAGKLSLQAFRIAGTGLIFLLTGLLSVTAADNRVDKPEYYEYSATLPDHHSGYWLVPKPYLKELDPVEYPSLSQNPRLSTFATQGEREQVTFVIYATQDLKNIQISTSDLLSENDTISAEHLKLRTVMRAPQIKNFLKNKTVEEADEDDYIIANRFLPEFEIFDLSAQHLREIWITLKVPENTSAGVYTGTIQVLPQNRMAQSLPLSLEVLPVKLKKPASKRYGLYYRTRTQAGPKSNKLIINELKDIKAHHGEIIMMKPGISYDYNQNSGDYTPDYDRITNFLDLMKEAGISQTEAVINTGFPGLARSILNEEGYLKLAEQIPESDALADAAKKALDGLAALQSEYPDYQFVLSHMDEVFNHPGELPFYNALAQLVRDFSDFPLYITVHTKQSDPDIGYTDGSKHLRDSIAPYVDIRNNHGYQFDAWLSRGNTIKEYQEELDQSGNIAWQYYNPTSWVFTPEWERIISGLYMWVAPFEARVDWIYNSFSGNPLDEKDGGRHDFGYAFPHPEKEAEIIPTRGWEGWREGAEDIIYLYTLEQLIAENPQSQDAQDAQRWLEDLQDRYPNFQEAEPCPYAVGQARSPVIYTMSQEFDFEDYKNIRYTTAQFILKLQE